MSLQDIIKNYLPPFGNGDVDFLLMKLLIWALLIVSILFAAITRFLLIPRYSGKGRVEEIGPIVSPTRLLSGLKADLKEILVVLKTEKMSTEVGLREIDHAYEDGEIGSDVYEKMKSMYAERMQKIDAEIQRRSGAEELRKLEDEFDSVRLGYMERLKTAVTTAETEAARSETAVEAVSEPEAAVATPPISEIEQAAPEAVEKPEIPEAPPASAEAAVSEEKAATEAESMFAKSTSIAALRSEMLKALKRLKGFMETE